MVGLLSLESIKQKKAEELYKKSSEETKNIIHEINCAYDRNPLESISGNFDTLLIGYHDHDIKTAFQILDLMGFHTSFIREKGVFYVGMSRLVMVVDQDEIDEECIRKSII